MVVTIGWTEVPPSFCTTTEMATDLANWSPSRGEDLGPHHLDHRANPTPDTTEYHTMGSLAPQEYSPTPISLVDVYVDDIIGATQGSVQRRLQVTQAILHLVNKVLHPLEPTDLPKRQEPVSLKKLDKGDGCMSTKKTVLGWELNTRTLTIHLTAQHHQHLLDILNDLPWTQKRISVNAWQKVLRELCCLSCCQLPQLQEEEERRTRGWTQPKETNHCLFT